MPLSTRISGSIGTSTASSSTVACGSTAAGAAGAAATVLSVGAPASVFFAFQFLEAELVVFLHLAHLLLHLQDLEVEFLDGAGERAHLFFQRGDARIAGLRELHGLGRLFLAAEELRQADLGQSGVSRRLDRLQDIENSSALVGLDDGAG